MNFTKKNGNRYEELKELTEEQKRELTEEKTYISQNILIYMYECWNCGEKHYLICNNANYDYTDFGFENYQDNIICENCCENDFAFCECCNELHHIEDTTYIEFENICNNCLEEYYFTCDYCGEIERRENRILAYNESGNEIEICESCCNNVFFTCDNCNEIFHVDLLNETENGHVCNECYNNCVFNYNNVTNKMRENEELINIDNMLEPYSDTSAICDYHNNPIPFNKITLENENTTEFYGIELEISSDNEEFRNSISKAIAQNFYVRIEKDSSLNGYGMELISNPISWNKWNERKNKINKLFELLKEYNYTSHDNGSCGLHIHINRDFLGDTIEKQENTINNLILISENFKNELIKFSRRKDLQWCHFLTDSTSEKITSKDKIKELKGTKGRYQVFNLLNNNTIEFRLNRGTLNTTTFYATLQLCKNMIEYAKSNNIIGIKWVDIISKNNFEELQEYNKIRNIESNSKLIDTTLQDRIKRIKEDRRFLKKSYTQKEFIKELEKNEIKMYKELEKIGETQNNSFYILISESKRRTLNSYINEFTQKIRDLRGYINYNKISYTTINKTSINYWNIRKKEIENRVKDIENLKEDIKKYYNELMEV